MKPAKLVMLFEPYGTVLRREGFFRGTIYRKRQAWRRPAGAGDARLRTRKEAIAFARVAGATAIFDKEERTT